MIKILHLEDNATDAELVIAALCNENIACGVTRVETRKAFLEALDHGDWDIILSDYLLPSFDGISGLKLATETHPDIPFIFVTGALGEDRAVETLKKGATDYIPKHRLDRLPQAITRARRESESVKAQKQAEHQLKASLREKVLLLQEVHHRVKNNLQVIIGLLSMQSTVIDDLRMASAFEEAQKRILSMSLVHEMLYASDSLADIDFAEYTRLLATELSVSYGIDPAQIRLTFELEPILLDIGQAIPCGLILNELLSNAFKYAFPKGLNGEIRVSLRKQEDSIRLSIEDTGIGLPEGNSPDEVKTLGLKLVNILRQQLNGSMETTSHCGSQFVLKFAQTIGHSFLTT